MRKIADTTFPRNRCNKMLTKIDSKPAVVIAYSRTGRLRDSVTYASMKKAAFKKPEISNTVPTVEEPAVVFDSFTTIDI